MVIYSDKMYSRLVATYKKYKRTPREAAIRLHAVFNNNSDAVMAFVSDVNGVSAPQRGRTS